MTPSHGSAMLLEIAADVLAIVRDVQGEQGGDPRRCHVTGFSFGGNGVFDLALAPPDTRVALWPPPRPVAILVEPS